MKFKVGDQVIVTIGKDKGKKSQIIRVLPCTEKVVVADINLYTKHIKKYGTQTGQKTRIARPISPAKIAILNEKENLIVLAINLIKMVKNKGFSKKLKL